MPLLSALEVCYKVYLRKKDIYEYALALQKFAFNQTRQII